jgi:hypothetical protein
MKFFRKTEDYVPDVNNFNYQVGNYDDNSTIRMSNVKPGKDNMEVKLVRNALSKMFPHVVRPGSEYTYQLERAIKKWQKRIGKEQTGILTRDEAIALGEQADPSFNVV